jgi:CRISPR system Cascade subunit CasC
MENRLFVDIHAIQSLPPSNVNRDDTGSPKTAIYGGVRRSRVSSQSWKRAIRQYFNTESAEDVGIRSLNVVKYVSDLIVAKDSSLTTSDAMSMAEKVFNDAGVKTKDQKAKALFFLGKKQAILLADAALKRVSNQSELKKILSDNPSVDIALFGRMVADDPSLNEDASVQVAHAISTHEVQTEFDFYTALDDLAPEDNAGAGMLGTVEFNSSTLYRYANIAVHDLVRQLKSGDQAVSASKLFIEAFANSMPTGKSNTFANLTLPHLLMVNIRKDRPVNLVTAFENPVKSYAGNSKGNSVTSIERLFAEVKKTEKFVQTPLRTFYVVNEDVTKPEWGTEEKCLTSLLNDFVEVVTNCVQGRS